jgi:hypothetical protein
MDPIDAPNTSAPAIDAPNTSAPAEEAPSPRDLTTNSQPQAQLFGIPVILIVLILFVILIAVLSWFGFISGDLL